MTILLAAVLAATGYVTDAAGMLDAAGRAALENRVRAYEKLTGTEIAIVTVPSLYGESVEGYANDLFHAWGIGKRGKDNGVLLLWAPTEHKVRIEVGYGLEQALPDGRAGQIIREVITPRFRARQWEDGLHDGVNAIIAQLDSQSASSPAPAAAPPADFPWFAFFLITGGAAAVLYTVIYFGTRRRREQRRPYHRHEPSYYWQSDPVPVPVVAVDPARPRHHSSSSSSSPSWHDSSSSSSFGSSDSGSSSSGSDSGGFGGGDSGGAGASGSY